MNQIHAIVEGQRAYFATDATRDLDFRRQQLLMLDSAIRRNERALLDALYEDLHKSDFESYETEIGLVYGAIRHTLRHLASWAGPSRLTPSLTHFPSTGTLYREPYGVVLIMSPWNYPFQLAMLPLIGALAAGNCAVVKPSAYTPATSRVVRTILEECFDPAYVAVVTGGREENQSLLEEEFDYIFFTGSPTVGKAVLAAAARYLTPVTLELGGKSPCIVDETADLRLTAARLVWGKLVNCGQTCVAPDYLLVQESVRDRLLVEIQKQIARFYGPDPLQSPDYPKIVNRKHFDRLLGLMERGTVVLGGQVNELRLQIAPTVFYGISWDDPIMQEEIFGPLLPILTYKTLEELLPKLRKRPKPLALYLFTTDKGHEKQVLEQLSFGGGCVNDTIIHVANENIPFGGVGNSGMGRYHGKATFDTFTHEKPVVKKANWLDVPLRYPPYGKHLKLLRKVLR